MSTTATLGFLAAFALAVVSTVVARAMARRFGVVAHPRADRWHHRPTATLGGVAIALGFSVPVLAVAPLHEVGPVIALAMLVTALGLADDLRHLTPATKLAGQSLLAAGALAAGYRLGWTGSMAGDSLLTFVWLVGLTNAFNLLDNMDGLAAGIALIGAAGYLMLALAHGMSWDVVMLAAYAGATAGFLVFNFPPASIFMGDAGSLFLGFTLALLAVRSGAGLDSGGGFCNPHPRRHPVGADPRHHAGHTRARDGPGDRSWREVVTIRPTGSSPWVFPSAAPSWRSTRARASERSPGCWRTWPMPVMPTPSSGCSCWV